MIEFFGNLEAWVSSFNSFLWGTMFLIPLLVGTGLFLTFRLRFVQVRKFPLALKYLCGGATLFGKRADKTGMSSFQALTTAIAAQVGTGNVAGTATAIVAGGAGAIFWLWCAAFFGMATIFAEAVLAQVYKTTDKAGHVVGGPAYYMVRGMGPKAQPLAIFFAVAIIIALGFIGNMVQSNTIAVAFNSAFSIEKWIVGAFVCVLAFLVFIGGMGRIASVTEKLVPAMAVLYLIGGIYVLCVHAGQILPVFSLIINSAFSPEAVFGGAVGISIREAMRYGVARGLFANEAGMGSTPHAHAVAKVDHPCQQGLVAIFGVFTVLVIVTFTGLVILTSGVYKLGTAMPASQHPLGYELTYDSYPPGHPAVVELEGKLNAARQNLQKNAGQDADTIKAEIASYEAQLGQMKHKTGIELTQQAYGVDMGNFGSMFVGICLFFFAFSTIVGWYFFGAQNVRYLFGENAVSGYRIAVAIFVFLGSFLEVNLVWQLADLFNGLMVVPNLIALWFLNKVVVKHLREFEGLMSGEIKPSDIRPDKIYTSEGWKEEITPTIAINASPEQFAKDQKNA